MENNKGKWVTIEKQIETECSLKACENLIKMIEELDENYKITIEKTDREGYYKLTDSYGDDELDNVIYNSLDCIHARLTGMHIALSDTSDF